MLFPDINFIPPDRRNGSREIQSVAQRIRDGMDITCNPAFNIGEGAVMAESTSWRIEMKTLTPATAVFGAGKWPFSASSRSPSYSEAKPH